MTIATQYAKALDALLAEQPQGGKDFLANLRLALKARGHEKLLPQILAEYEKISLGQERVRAASAVTPERERTRVLFELYKKLTA